MPNVSYVRPELKAKLNQYNQIIDCIEGEEQVKSKETIYLPQPNPTDESLENLARYDAYLKRAVFYNVVDRTLTGLVGQIFAKDAVIELPRGLDVVGENANGEGVTLTQLAKKTTAEVVALGRSGLWVDYPTTDGVTTRSDLESGYIRPVILTYDAKSIINWRTKERGAKQILSLVVLQEDYITSDDGFETETKIQWRVLRLGKSPENMVPGLIDDDDVYTVEIWKDIDNKSGISEAYQPQDAAGKYLTEIPFTFVGSLNNDSDVDTAPMYDMSVMNIGHFRNSADYEESCFVTGQPTVFVSGLTEDWLTKVLGGKITFGARGGVALPLDAGAELLQAAPNSMPFEAMQHKERQMVSLGAKLVEQSTVQRTATEAGIESANENSVLATISKNVSNAYKFALEQCTLFTGDSGNIVFELNSDFDSKFMSLDDTMKIVSTWQQGALSFTEMRENLDRMDITTQTSEEAANEIEIEKKAAIELENQRVQNNQPND